MQNCQAFRRVLQHAKIYEDGDEWQKVEFLRRITMDMLYSYTSSLLEAKRSRKYIADQVR